MAEAKSEDFYTLTGYQHREQGLTPALEDYLEMICRLESQGSQVIRLGELSQRLHVAPSSASRMIRQLEGAGFICAPRYGYITVTPNGRKAGEYLLWRHEVVQRFLCALNGSSSELEQAEKLEHFLNQETLRNLARLTERLEREAEANNAEK